MHSSWTASKSTKFIACNILVIQVHEKGKMNKAFQEAFRRINLILNQSYYYAIRSKGTFSLFLLKR